MQKEKRNEKATELIHGPITLLWITVIRPSAVLNLLADVEMYQTSHHHHTDPKQRINMQFFYNFVCALHNCLCAASTAEVQRPKSAFKKNVFI